MEGIPEPPVRVILWHPTRRTYHQFSTVRLFFRWATDNLEPRHGAGVHYVDLTSRDVRRAWAVCHDDRWMIADDHARVLEVADIEPLTSARQRRFASQIEEQLVRLDEIVDFHIVGIDEWRCLPLRPHHMYGYMAPIDRQDRIEAWVCPALIDEQTADLPEWQAEEYVFTVTIRMAKEYACFEQGRLDEEIVAVVDTLMSDALPHGWKIVQEVEQRVVNSAAHALLDGS